MAKKLAFDRVLFTVVLGLTAFGLVMIYSASYSGLQPTEPGVDAGLNPYLTRQLVAACVGLALMAGAMFTDYRRLTQPVVVYSILGVCIALLVTVLFTGEWNNTHRWLRLGPVSLQPSELAKLALVAYVAYQIDKNLPFLQEEPHSHQGQLLIPCAVVAGLLAGLVKLQPDLSSALLLGTVALLLLFLAGMRWRYILLGGALVIPVLVLAVMQSEYQRARIEAFFAEPDPLHSGYQIDQSLIAIGSGGLVGRGLGEGLQKLAYLPYPQSDFIFSIVAEELGLLGAMLLLGLFGVLLWRGVRAGVRAPEPLGRYLAWGFTGMLVIQAFLNVGVAVRLLPTTGIPLPFISYGGTSLVVSLIACGVILNVSQHA